MIAALREGLRRLDVHLAGVFCVALLAYAAWPWLPGVTDKPPRTLVFYGFSILDEAINKDVFPAFQARWSERSGEHVELATSFGGSGTITNQIILGVPAELALLSLELDAQRLADARRVPQDAWKRLPHGGVLNRTPFVILVREGNPKGIHDFADLARPGIEVVHPDPATSGGANWAILAEYGAGERDHPGGGRELLAGLWANVTAQAGSARAARTQFENGFGDALVTYEQELLRDRARGKLKGDIVYPRSTVLSEHVLVVLDHNVSAGDRESVDALVEYLWTPEAQRLFASNGFRSVLDGVTDDAIGFGTIEDPFTVADFGGWTRAKADIVDAVWRDDVMARRRK